MLRRRVSGASLRASRGSGPWPGWGRGRRGQLVGVAARARLDRAARSPPEPLAASRVRLLRGPEVACTAAGGGRPGGKVARPGPARAPPAGPLALDDGMLEPEKNEAQGTAALQAGGRLSVGCSEVRREKLGFCFPSGGPQLSSAVAYSSFLGPSPLQSVWPVVNFDRDNGDVSST